MPLKVGRLEGGLPIEVVDNVSIDGDSLSISGTFVEDTPDELAARLQQVAGLAALTDELVVPVTWDSDHAFVEGFYRVRGATTDFPRSADLTHGPFSLNLERVAGYKSPLFESIIQGGDREQAPDNLVPNHWMALPASVRSFEIGANLTPSFGSRICADGLMTVFTDPGNTLKNARPEFMLDPANWYVGASTLRIGGKVQVGRQVPNTPLDWQVSNGCIRLTANSTGFTIENWNGTAWDRPIAVLIRRRTGSSTTAVNTVSPPHTITVMRNTPEEVAIRLSHDAASATVGARFSVRTDISLRRGSRTAAIRVYARGTYDWGLTMSGFPTTGWTAGASPSAAVWANGYVAGRDKYSSMLASGSLVYLTSQSGTAGRPFVAGIGYYDTAAATGTLEHPESIYKQWAANQREKTNAVAR